MFIIDSTNYKTSKGGIVTVYGVGFNADCVVTVDGLPQAPTDYDDGFICFSAPDSEGTHRFTISDGVSTSDSLTLYVVAFEDLNTYRLPDRSESSFLRMLDGLMPRGFAWQYGNGSNWSKLLSGIALSFAYVYEMLKNLILQMSPATTTSLGLWENELGLPHRGLEQSTDAGRKSEIMRVARKKGGATVPYLKSLLKLYGVRNDIYEFWKNPEVFPAWVSNEGENANYYVLIKVYRDSYYGSGFTCISPCNASLGEPRDSILESIVAQEKPAHVKVIYSYVLRVLTDESGNPLVDENNRIITV